MRERILFIIGFAAMLAVFGLAGKSDRAVEIEMRALQAPIIPTTTTTTTTTTTISPKAEADAAISAALRRQADRGRSVSTITPPTTTTTVLVPNTALCGEWWVTALAAGWEEHHLPTLDRIMWNESRCQVGLVSNTNDVGLVQLNVKTWSDIWEEDGFTTEEVRDNPVLNLMYGKQVSDAAASYGWCIWQPWHGYSGDYC